jgi:hypothetical protein
LYRTLHPPSRTNKPRRSFPTIRLHANRHGATTSPRSPSPPPPRPPLLTPPRLATTTRPRRRLPHLTTADPTADFPTAPPPLQHDGGSPRRIKSPRPTTLPPPSSPHDGAACPSVSVLVAAAETTPDPTACRPPRRPPSRPPPTASAGAVAANVVSRRICHQPGMSPYFLLPG